MQTLNDLETLLNGDLPETEARALLLKMTPESMTLSWLTEIVQTMRRYQHPDLDLSFDRQRFKVLDCCGTGGSGLPHFNVSTTSAFVLAAAGVSVVKFGNRASTGLSGSFDLLSGLGFPTDLPFHKYPNLVNDLLEECGLVFLYAPQIYPAFARLAPLRRSLKVKTVFNFVGPLLNPVIPPLRLLGVSDATMHPLIADYLKAQPENQLSWVVTGENGQDEISVTANTQISKISASGIQTQSILAQSEATLDSMDSFSRFQAILSGEDTQSLAYRDVCLNTAAGLCIANKVTSIEAGYQMAEALLAEREVVHKFEKCQRRYEQLG